MSLIFSSPIFTFNNLFRSRSTLCWNTWNTPSLNAKKQASSALLHIYDIKPTHLSQEEDKFFNLDGLFLYKFLTQKEKICNTLVKKTYSVILFLGSHTLSKNELTICSSKSLHPNVRVYSVPRPGTYRHISEEISIRYLVGVAVVPEDIR